MARVWKGRYVNPLIWEDEWFQSLTMSEQHLFNYLLTNPRTTETNIGVYQLNLNTAAYHTKIDLQEVKRIFIDRFQPDQRAFNEVGWIVMPKWIRHQSTNNNVNMWTRAANQFAQIPDWLNILVLDKASPMYMDVSEMSEGILRVIQEPNRTVKDGKVSFGTVVNGSLKEREIEREIEQQNQLSNAVAKGSRNGEGKGGRIKSDEGKVNIDNEDASWPRKER